MTTLTANQLTLSYNGKPIVSDFAFSVSDGELVGLLGPNGAGKTTILRALAGLMRPRGGVALLNGQDVASIPATARARDIGMIPQSEHHVWPLTIEEAVTLGRAPHRGWFLPMSVDDKQVVDHVLQVTGLQNLRQRPVDKLSGGERQRMIIARALAQEPRVMLLDEPTSNLDVHHQFQVLDLVRKLVNERGLSAIIAIHDLALAARYCDRLVLIHEGRSFASGKPEEVLTPSNLMHVFGIEAELYRDPQGRLALCVH